MKMKSFMYFCISFIVSMLVITLFIIMADYAINWPTKRNCRQGDINGDFPPPEVCAGIKQ